MWKKLDVEEERLWKLRGWKREHVEEIRSGGEKREEEGQIDG